MDGWNAATHASTHAHPPQGETYHPSLCGLPRTGVPQPHRLLPAAETDEEEAKRNPARNSGNAHTCASRLRPMPATGFARSSPLLSTTYSWSPRLVHTRRCGRPLIGFGLVRVGTPSLARLGGEAREGGSRMQISSDTCPLSIPPRWISLTREAGFSWDGAGTAATPHHTTPTTFRAVCVIWIRRAILCSNRKGEVFAISDR